ITLGVRSCSSCINSPSAIRNSAILSQVRGEGGCMNEPLSPFTMKAMAHKERIKFFFVIPGILWVLIFTTFRLMYSLRLSFFHARIVQDHTFIGMGSFQGAFSDCLSWNSLSITVFFVVVSVS